MSSANTSALKELFLSGVRDSAKRPNVFGYKPHELQEKFHRDSSTGRIFLGGNRAGKTVAGAVETVYRLRGSHPFQRVPPAPIRARGSAVDIEQGIKKIMLPEIARWIPPSDLINGSWEDSYDKQGRVLSLRSGSTMDFLTYEMDVDKHAGTSRHWQWFDEEPPQYVFNEDLLRLVDTGGKWCLTMTPVQGMTWIYYSFFRPIVEEEDVTQNVAVFQISTVENPYISQAILEEMTRGLSEAERMARRHGQFMAATGLIFPEFNEHLHVIPPLDISQLNHRTIICGMDHGLRNPTAWLWSIVDHEGRLTIFHEYYQAERTIREHVQEIKEFEELYGFKVEENGYRIGDPAISQRNAISGGSVQSEYADHGVYIGTGNNDVNYGLNRVRSYIQASGLFITNNCVNLIKELRNYRWDTWATRKNEESKEAKDKPRKVKDHAVDAMRYLVCSRPEEEFTGPAGHLYLPFAVSKQIEDPVTEASYRLDSPNEGIHAILGDDW
jgi:phage terminase large subunit-like protein